MLKHIVFFQMIDAEGNTAEKNAEIMADWFKKISTEIPGVVSFESGKNVSNEKAFYHLCVNQTFENEEALKQYLVHPLHLELREFLFKVIDHRVLVDYLI